MRAFSHDKESRSWTPHSDSQASSVKKKKLGEENYPPLGIGRDYRKKRAIDSAFECVNCFLVFWVDINICPVVIFDQAITLWVKFQGAMNFAINQIIPKDTWEREKICIKKWVNWHLFMELQGLQIRRPVSGSLAVSSVEAWKDPSAVSPILVPSICIECVAKGHSAWKLQELKFNPTGGHQVFLNCSLQVLSSHWTTG